LRGRSVYIYIYARTRRIASSSSGIEATDKVRAGQGTDGALFSFFFSFHHRRRNVATNTSGDIGTCFFGRVVTESGLLGRTSCVRTICRRSSAMIPASSPRSIRQKIAPRRRKNSASNGRSPTIRGAKGNAGDLRGEHEEGSFYDGAPGRLGRALFPARGEIRARRYISREIEIFSGPPV